MRFVLSTLVIILAVISSRWALWYYGNVDFTSLEALIALVSSITASVLALAGRVQRARVALLARRVVFHRITVGLAAVLNMAVLMMAVLLCRVDVQWDSTYSVVPIAQSSTFGFTTAQDNEAGTLSLFGPAFTHGALIVRSAEHTFRFMPFYRQQIALPSDLLEASSPEYREINTLLNLTFFQFLEGRFLNEVKLKLQTEAGTKFVMFDLIYQISRLCFIEQDTAETAPLLLEKFRDAYGDTNWRKLLQACYFFSKREYAQAADEIEETKLGEYESPKRETITFFRGVCRLRHYIESQTEGQTVDVDAARAAKHEFKKVVKSLGSASSSFFRDVALPSAHIFLGITAFYERRMDDAKKSFAEATKTSLAGLRARGFNNLGYVNFLTNDLDDAEKYLLQALEADATFPYAKTNLGYVYLAKERFDQAERLFLLNARDEKLRIESPRDVFLAKAALGHLAAERFGPASETFTVYEDALSALGLTNYPGVEPPLLRLARIHLLLGDRLYRNTQYYGLEVVALAMFALAYEEANSAASAAGASQLAVETRDEALAKFEETRKFVDPSWFTGPPPEGLFRSVSIA